MQRIRIYSYSFSGAKITSVSLSLVWMWNLQDLREEKLSLLYAPEAQAGYKPRRQDTKLHPQVYYFAISITYLSICDIQ